MYHITVSPDTYEITPNLFDQNPFIQKDVKPNHENAIRQHINLRKKIHNLIHFTVKTNESIPDLVFIASGGLSLPNLPEPVVILPNMKYSTRKAELPYIKDMMEKLHIQTYEFPGPYIFEGEAEAKWLQAGKILLHGYGYRSTKESTRILKNLIHRIYKHYDVEPPVIIPLALQNSSVYHLDMALLAYSDNGCIVQQNSIQKKGLHQMRKRGVEITEVQTSDPFALNGIVLKDKIITHVQTDKHIKNLIERLSKKTVVEVQLTEFEKAGGVAKCLVMTIYDPSLSK